MSDFFRKFNKSVFISLLALFLMASLALAGSLTPPGAPGSTMNTLAELYDSIVGGFDSTGVVADQNGSLIEHLKYIEANMSTGGGVGSDSLDFDEFVDNMTLDADTTIAKNGFALSINDLSTGSATGLQLDIGADGPSAFAFGLSVAAHDVAGSAVDSVIFGQFLQAASDATGTATVVDGLLTNAIYEGVGTAAQVIGGQFATYGALTTSNIDIARGLYIIGNTSGHTEENYGIDVDGYSTLLDGTITNNYGIRVRTAGSVISNSYGLYIDPVHGSTTSYGLFIDGDAPTPGNPNPFNIYSAGSDTHNVFEGNASVSGDFEVTGTIFANGGCIGCGGVSSDSLDFDEFVDNMTLDADTNIDGAGFILSISGPLNVGNNQGAFPTGLGGDEPLIINHRTTTDVGDGITSLYTMAPTVDGGVGRAGQFDLFTELGNVQDFTDIEGIQAAVFHQGSGNVTTLNGGSFFPGNDGPGNVSEMNGLSVQIVNDGGGSITNASGLHVSVPFVPSPTGGNVYGVRIDDQSSAGANAWNLYSAGDDSINRFEGHMAIGNQAFIGDLFGGIPGQTLMSLHEEFTDLSTFGLSAGTAHTYDLNPTGTATDTFFGEDVFVQTDATNTEDFTGGIVAGRYYPLHLGSGTVSQMDGLQVQPQTDNGTVTQMRGILVSTNTTGTGDIGDAYAIYVDAPLGVGGITNNYGLFLEDQSGSTGDSFNIFSAGAGSLNVFEGNTSASSDFEVNGHTAMGNVGGVDNSLLAMSIFGANTSVLALNERITTPPAVDSNHGISNDLEIELAADTTASFTGQGNYVTTTAANAGDIFQIVGTYNALTNFGTGDITSMNGGVNSAAHWGTGTVNQAFGSYNNACNCPGGGNITEAYGTYTDAQSSSTGTIATAYDLFAGPQFGGGTITNNYGIYIAPQNGAGVVNGYNLYSAGAGTRNIFEGSASISQNFELSGTVSSNLTPTVTNTYDLGTSALRWRNIFANNASISNNLEVSNVASFSQLFVGGNQFTGIGVTSDSLDFDEFKDVMALDATTTIASGGFSLGIDTQGYTPTAALSIGRNPMSQGFLSSTTAAKLSVVRRMTTVGIPLNTALFQNIWDLPAAGGGGTSVTIFNQIASSSAQNMTGQLTGLTAGSENVGTGTATTLIGVQAVAQNRNTGTTTNARAILAGAGSFGGGTVTNGYGVYALPSGTGSTITNMFGFYAARRAAGTTVTVSNWAGVGIEHLTEATNNTAILIGSTSAGLTVPAGNWGIYDGSPYPNYFGARASIAGNFGPTITNAFDLGSSTLRWRDLYLASSSLHIGASGDEAMIDYNVTSDYLALKPNGSTNQFQLFDTGAASLSNTLYVTSGGNVGIGTTTPAALVELRRDQDATTVPVLRLRNDGTGANTGTSVDLYVGAVLAGQLKGTFGADFGQVANTYQVSLQSGTAALGILPSDDVVVANTGANNARLFVFTSAAVATGNTAELVLGPSTGFNADIAPRVYAFQETGTNTGLRFDTYSGGRANRMVITGTGNVGIGTTNLSQLLEVAGTASISGVMISDEGAFKRIQSFDSEELYLNPLGNSVKVGNATSTLEVVGFASVAIDSFLHGGLRIDGVSGAAAGAGLVLSDESGYKNIQSYNSESIVLNALGNNIGIGTTTVSAVLHVVGDQAVLLNVASASNSRFAVLEGGNVGIGTATPNDTLDVAGAIEFNIASSSTALNSFALCHNVNGNSSNQELLDCGSLPVADYMEMYPMARSVQEGDIVMVSHRQIQTTNGQGTVPELVKADDRNLAIGIVSVAAHAGDFNSIGYNIPQSARPMPLALVGRVNVKISMENGPISAGDPIALSGTPGIGAKAETSGYIIGRALESASSAGTVLVFVNPTYWAASAAELTDGAPPIGAVSGWLSGTFSDLFAAVVSSFRDVLGVVFERGGRIRATELCLDDVCVTKEQLREMLSNQGTATPEPSDDPTPTPSVEPGETLMETPDSEPTVTPEPEATPPSEEEEEPAPAPEPPSEPSPEDSGL